MMDGCTRRPSLATAPATIAICKGVAETAPCPMAAKALLPFSASASVGKMDLRAVMPSILIGALNPKSSAARRSCSAVNSIPKLPNT